MSARTRVVIAMAPCALAMVIWWKREPPSRADGPREVADSRSTDVALVNDGGPGCLFVTQDDGGPGIWCLHDVRSARCWFVQRGGDTRAIRCPPGYVPRTGLDGEPLDAGESGAEGEVAPCDGADGAPDGRRLV